jgi:transcriptional regulator with XRE-family HTH domain
MEKQILRRLREIRYEKGEKLIMIAQHLNIDESTFYKIENGRVKSWNKYLFALLEYYQKPVAEFFSELEGKNFIQHQENKDQVIGQLDGGTVNYADKTIVKNLLNKKDETISLLKEKIARLELERTLDSQLK